MPTVDGVLMRFVEYLVDDGDTETFAYVAVVAVRSGSSVAALVTDSAPSFSFRDMSAFFKPFDAPATDPSAANSASNSSAGSRSACREARKASLYSVLSCSSSLSTCSSVLL